MEKFNRIAVLFAVMIFATLIVSTANGQTFLRKWGTLGAGDGQFYRPHGIAVNTREVYVAEILNHRIQVFDLNGNFLRKWGTYGAGNGQLSYPNGIAVGPGAYFDGT